MIDEKDTLIMKLQAEIETLKADDYSIQVGWNDEKQKSQRDVQKAEKEAEAIQMQLKQIEDLVGF